MTTTKVLSRDGLITAVMYGALGAVAAFLLSLAGVPASAARGVVVVTAVVIVGVVLLRKRGTAK